MKLIIRNLLYVLRRFKMATLLNILGLSVAYAAFMIIMMQVDYDRNFDRFHKNADKIYRLDFDREGEGKQAILSRPMADIIFGMPQVKKGSIRQGFQSQTSFSVVGEDGEKGFKEGIRNIYPSFMEQFNFEILEGDKPENAKPETAFLSESQARKLFGKESAIGKSLKFNQGGLMISGVYRDFPKNSSVENILYKFIGESENKESWGNWNYNVFVELTSPNDIDVIKKNLEEELIKLNKREGWYLGSLVFTPIVDIHFVNDVAYDNSPKTSRQTVVILILIAFIIIIIAAINFTNFSMALAPMRIKSINTQKVMGATNTALRISLLVEALLINIVAYLLALVFVYLSSKSFISSVVDADINLLAFPGLVSICLFISLFIGLLSGLYPAFYITSFRSAMVLKGSFGLSPKGKQLRNVLISIQYIASFVLIVVALFMYLQNVYMQKQPLGYDKDQLIVTDLSNRMWKELDLFSNEIKNFAGIEDISYCESLLSSSNEYMGWGRMSQDRSIQFQALPVHPSFLSTMGIKVTEGRDFREDDKSSRRGKYIFNEIARNEYNLQLNAYVDSSEIIGFISDIRFKTFRAPTAPMAFYVWGSGDGNWGLRANYAYIKVAAGSDMLACMQHVKKILQKIDPVYPADVRFYDDVLNNVYEKEQRLTSLITLFGLIAVLLSIIGVFGLVVFESEYRKKEVSLRKVLGSSIKEVLTLFNKTYIIILSICFVIACPIAYLVVDKWLDNFVERTPLHWWVFAASWVLIALVTVLTVSWQSWRTASSNPVNALKND